MNEHEIRSVAEAAAEAAVNKVLLRLGIDPEDENAIPESKADFVYLRRLRRGSETFKKEGLTTLASILTTFLIGAAVAAFYKWRP